MQVYYLPPLTAAGYLHDGSTKGICEAAATDWKYALPLLWYQPIVYGAFGACYLVTDHPTFRRGGFLRKAARTSSLEQLGSGYKRWDSRNFDLPQESKRDTVELFGLEANSPSPEAPSSEIPRDAIGAGKPLGPQLETGF
jgi:hypothetical protein